MIKFCGEHTIPVEQLKLGRKIASGEFGCINRGWLEHASPDFGKITVAIKTVKSREQATEYEVYMLNKEALLMTKLQHENVIRMHVSAFQLK